MPGAQRIRPPQLEGVFFLNFRAFTKEKNQLAEALIPNCVYFTVSNGWLSHWLEKSKSCLLIEIPDTVVIWSIYGLALQYSHSKFASQTKEQLRSSATQIYESGRYGNFASCRTKALC